MKCPPLPGIQLKVDMAGLLAVLSGLVGSSLSLSGHSSYLLLYVTWLLVSGFISMTYTTLLLSIVVVPSTHTSHHTFDEMIRQNYTLASVEQNYIRERSGDMSFQYLSVSGAGKAFKMLEMQKQLANRLTKFEITSLSDYYTLVQEFSEGTNKAFIWQTELLETLELFLPRKDGWQMVVSTQKSFSLIPYGGTLQM